MYVRSVFLTVFLCVGIVSLAGANPLPGNPVEYNVDILYPTDDARIKMSKPDTNYGSNSNLWIRNRYGSPYHPDHWESDALLKFDLSNLPPDANINSATLNMYYYYWKDNNPTGRELTAYKIIEDWDEMTVTFNNQPSTAPELSASSTVPADYGWMSWDVSEDVQDYVNGQTENYGWKIMDEEYWGQYNIPRIYFYTKEWETAEFIPFLEISYSGEEPTSISIEMAPHDNPAAVQLHANYPNPFNPATSIEFVLPAQANVKLEIYDIMGRKVAALADGAYDAGRHTVSWDASDQSSGVYFYRLEAGDKVVTKRMTLLK